MHKLSQQREGDLLSDFCRQPETGLGILRLRVSQRVLPREAFHFVNETSAFGTCLMSLSRCAAYRVAGGNCFIAQSNPTVDELSQLGVGHTLHSSGGDAKLSATTSRH